MSPTTTTRSRAQAKATPVKVAPVRRRAGELPALVYLEALPLARIHPSPDNPREEVTNLDGLAASIKSGGVRQPIRVIPRDGGDIKSAKTHFDIVFGHRRFYASDLAGRTTIPALASPTRPDDEEIEVIRVVENAHRVELNPIEQARAFRRLRDTYGLTQKQIAARTGYEQPHISKRLTLLRLPREAQTLVGQRRIPVNDGLELVKLPKPAIEEVVKQVRSNVDPQTAIRKARDVASRSADRLAAINSLSRMGVEATIMDRPTSWDSDAGPYPLRFMPGVDPTKHAKGSCHAAFVLARPQITTDDLAGPVDRWAVMVCTQPSRHPDGELRAAGALDAEAQRISDAEQTVTAERREFMRNLLRSDTRLPRAAVNEHVMRGLILAALAAEGDAPWLAEARRLADDLLGTTTNPDATVSMRGDALLRTGLALRLAVDEVAYTAGRRVSQQLAAEHLDFLERLGYTVTPTEYALLEAADEPGGLLVS